MESQSIAEIRDQVFEYLLEWHFAERAKGRDFYFLIEKPDTYFLSEEDLFAVTFWQNKAHKNNTYNIGIVITGGGDVFFDVKQQTDNPPLEQEIKSVFINMDGNWANDQPNSYYIQLNRNLEAPLAELQYFIEHDKPDIDKIILKYGLADQSLETTAYYYQTDKFFAIAIRPDHFDEMLRRAVIEHRPQYAIPKTDKPGLLPHTLYSLEVWNYKGIKHTAIDNLPPETKWIFLTGLNGFGKSSILQAIAIALFGTSEGAYNLMGASDDPVIVADWVVYRDPVRLYRSKYQTNGRKVKVVAYGPGRLINTQTPPPENRERLKEGSVRSLFDNDHSLLNIEYELITSNAYQPHYFKLLKQLFYALIPDLQEISINNTSSPYVEYIEKSSEDGTYQAVTLNQLATGFRGIITMIGDMVLRLAADIDIKELKSLSDLKGIVLIDELELHLHPRYQKLLPGKLSELFPNVQFIASTHSPIPLLGAPKETVILKVDRTEDKGVVVEKLDIDISVLQPNAILTSPIFGFRDILAESH